MFKPLCVLWNKHGENCKDSTVLVPVVPMFFPCARWNRPEAKHRELFTEGNLDRPKTKPRKIAQEKPCIRCRIVCLSALSLSRHWHDFSKSLPIARWSRAVKLSSWLLFARKTSGLQGTFFAHTMQSLTSSLMEITSRPICWFTAS